MSTQDNNIIDVNINHEEGTFTVTLPAYKTKLPISELDRFILINRKEESPEYKITDESSKLEMLDFGVKRDPIVESILHKFQKRSEVGIKKYNSTLYENNRDNYFKHLQEELMDAVLYIEKLQSQLSGKHFISGDKQHALANGILYSVGDTVYKGDESATIQGFDISDAYAPEVKVFTDKGYTHLDFITK